MSNKVSTHEIIEFASMASHFTTQKLKIIEANFSENQSLNFDWSSNSDMMNVSDLKMR